MKFNDKTEKQKAFEYAMRLVEISGQNISKIDIIIKDIPIPHNMYMDSLRLMTDDNLVSHFKDRLEKDDFEQAEIIQKELDRRNIKIIYEKKSSNI